MSKTTLFLAVLVCLPAAIIARPLQETAPQTKQSTTATAPELKEADKLTHDIVKLYGERKLIEAIEVAKRVVKLRQSKLGHDDLLVADSIGNLAMLHLARRDVLNAEKAFRRASCESQRFAYLLVQDPTNSAVGSFQHSF